MAAKKRRVIGVDVDGVIADFLAAARRDLNLLFGKPAADVVQTSWAFESLGITDAEDRKFWKHVDSSPNWWLYLPKMPNATLLSDLDRSHRVIFITNRKDGVGQPVEDQTKQWIFKHFGINNPTVVLCGNKGPVAAGLGLDYFIDDRPRNVFEVIAGHPVCQTFIYDSTYNREEALAQIPRVKNFDEFAKIIKQGGL